MKYRFICLLLTVFAFFVLPAAAQRAPASTSTPIPGINHIIWVWFENRESNVINATTAPYFTSFAASNLNFSNFYGVAHPSQPNYIDAFAGSNMGVTNDNHFTIPPSADNLAKQLAAAGRSWRVYAQDYPGNCSDVDTFAGPVDGPGVAGTYVRKHNPAISFENIRLDPVQCANIQNLSSFDPMANFAFVVPNMINDMHDGTTAQGNTFLQSFVQLVDASPDRAHTLLIVTFDEGSSSANGGGHIYTAMSAPWITPGTATATYNHFSVLRTIEAAYGLAFLGAAATASTITQALPQARTAFDFDGDGKADETVFRPVNGSWYLNRSQSGFAGFQFGASGDVIAPSDFDGDGKTDIAVFRPSDGYWYTLRSSDSTFTGTAFGAAGDVPIPEDFDADSKADLTVFRPSVGTWFQLSSLNGTVKSTQFGTNGDVPTPGDFDGDGIADISVFRPSSGVWYRLNSSNGSFFAAQFGTAGDQTVPADFDGDAKTDLAVYRPSNGTWYRMLSSSGSFDGVQFGANGDVPAPADFDGDGKADVVVFRPSSGIWYELRSTSGFTAVQFGANGDVPAPSAFVK
jgi:Phosphoesterase family/FG-GAP-like repeat/FG-GAP repeat